MLEDIMGILIALVLLAAGALAIICGFILMDERHARKETDEIRRWLDGGRG